MDLADVLLARGQSNVIAASTGGDLPSSSITPDFQMKCVRRTLV